MKRDIGSATSDAPRSDVDSKELKCACGADKYSVEYFEAYGVVLCRDCKKNDPLINKTEAKKRYGLTDSDLDSLGHIARHNPLRTNWPAMLLYLVSQLKELSKAKWGDADPQAAKEEWSRMRIQKRKEREREREEKRAVKKKKFEEKKEELNQRNRSNSITSENCGLDVEVEEI